ncbi:condensin subunit ScpB [Chthonomonas calidirosea]|uniref:SMC-Scp complex subunit ScpB n=1 Tax=Chthonomonas calidirosea TaxID=454171 RepID=UPI0006DD4C5E|nr:SMC-Scp complex subunit ScpB [Chthonomonas calidirosea]CEK19237.1 condensin subunit ScpB [Chthonomonas calidirosea]
MSTTLEAALECLLFVSGEPLTVQELARATGEEPLRVEEALRSLQAALVERHSGLQLLRIAGGWQLATRPEYAEFVGRLLTPRANKLSRAALETLAIIAYRQPITGPEIEAIRGVSSDGVLKTLLERRLIAEAGKKASPGRPTLYVTTPEFLHYFGIASLEELPPLEVEPASSLEVSAESAVVGVYPRGE